MSTKNATIQGAAIQNAVIQNVSRRGFLKTVGLHAGGLVLLNPLSNMALAADGNFPLGVFVSIATSGEVTIVNHRAEMGQGILTSVPQVIAEELGVSWADVNVIQAKGDKKYGGQGTGGSASIRQFFPFLRQMGAVARDMLEQAAANEWKVKKAEVSAQDSRVIHKVSGKSLGFGELAKKAAELPTPDQYKVKLKSNTDFKLIGQDVKLAGQEDIVVGRAEYAQDIQLPNMLIASIQRPPVVGAHIKSVDDTEAKKVPGVVDVVKLKDRSFPVNVLPLGGVAVLANNTWAAQEARKKLKITWHYPNDIAKANAKHNSVEYLQDLVKKVATKGEAVRTEGELYAHSYSPERTLEATYTVPYHHHMSMETPAATAVVEGDKCRIWTGTQNPQWGKGMAAGELGISDDNIELNMTLMGGAFGRKGKNDYTIEAVELAKLTGRPVKVVWTREDDVKHGFYHSISANYFKAELTDKDTFNKTGKVADHWLQRVAYPPIGWLFNTEAKSGSDMMMGLGFADVPFELDSLQCEKHNVETHVRCGWFRAVANINNAFGIGCFVDELAVKASMPTHQMWKALIGSDRIVNPAKEGFSGWLNYDQKDKKEYVLDTRRMKGVIDVLVDASGADKKLPEGEAWGISYAHSFNSYVAAATRVKMVNGKWQAVEMHTAIDCGIAVTPDRVKSQMEGAMIMGLSIALRGEITVKDGAVEQGNFHDYPVARMNEVPPLHVTLIDSDAAPGGVGEPGLPPILPSIVNAVYHASGQRVRSLPIDLSKAVKATA